MTRQFVAILSAVALCASGCSSGRYGQAPADCTGGYATNGGCVMASQITGSQVAAQVEGYSLPPMNSRRMTQVRCTVSGDHKSAVCRGWLHSISQEGPGVWLTVRFGINSEGNLIPNCKQRPHNVFCAD